VAKGWSLFLFSRGVSTMAVGASRPKRLGVDAMTRLKLPCRVCETPYLPDDLAAIFLADGPGLICEDCQIFFLIGLLGPLRGKHWKRKKPKKRRK